MEALQNLDHLPGRVRKWNKNPHPQPGISTRVYHTPAEGEHFIQISQNYRVSVLETYKAQIIIGYPYKRHAEFTQRSGTSTTRVIPQAYKKTFPRETQPCNLRLG